METWEKFKVIREGENEKNNRGKKFIQAQLLNLHSS